MAEDTPVEASAPEADVPTEVVEEQPVVEETPEVTPETEAARQAEIDDHYSEAERLEVEADRSPGSTDSHTVGLLHSDTVYVEAEKIGREGPRQEQIHTSLRAG